MPTTHNTIKTGLIALAAVALAAPAFGQSTPQNRSGSAESSLIGISLYDTAVRVVSRFGSPDEIQALTVGGATAGGQGAGGGGRSGPGGAGGGGGGGGTGAGAAAVVEDSNRPVSPADMVGNPFGDGSEWRQMMPEDGDQPRAGGGRQQGAGGAGSGGGRAGTPGTTGGSSGGIEVTRWVYRRGTSRYSFIMDKFSRVVQIEAFGMNDSRVRTRRGVAFGSTFQRVIQAYTAPDSYEINGNTIVVKFLQRERVAFRLQKLSAQGKHVVTGVVVAAAGN